MEDAVTSELQGVLTSELRGVLAVYFPVFVSRSLADAERPVVHVHPVLVVRAL